MNLTQPPFDDVHVRRAMNWIIDKDALRQAWGGPIVGQDRDITSSPTRSSTTSSPTTTRTRRPGEHGSLAKAKAAMKGSKYDTTARRHVQRGRLQERAAPRPTRRRPSRRCFPSIEQTRRRSGSPSTCATVARRLPDARDDREEHPDRDLPGLGQGLRRPADVLLAALRRPHDHRRREHRTTRSSGSSRHRRRRSGVTGDATGVPNVDAQLDRCAVARRPAAALLLREPRQDLTTKVVPWVPYLWSTTRTSRART